MGSNPTSSKFLMGNKSVWRNWIARQTSNLKVAGSSPAMDTCSFEHLGSVPERSKGRDSRSLAICFVGSNPTAVTVLLAQLVRALVL